MKYFVHYVEDSTPKIKSFKTKRSMQAFLDKFLKKTDPAQGYWVDFIFKGKILSYNDYYQDLLEEK